MIHGLHRYFSHHHPNWIKNHTFSIRNPVQKKNKAFNLWIMHSQPHIEELYFLLSPFMLCIWWNDWNDKYFLFLHFFFSFIFSMKDFFSRLKTIFHTTACTKEKKKLGNFSFYSVPFTSFFLPHLVFIKLPYLLRACTLRLTLFYSFIVSRRYFFFRWDHLMCEMNNIDGNEWGMEANEGNDDEMILLDFEEEIYEMLTDDGNFW